jgi:hypothetical protein
MTIRKPIRSFLSSRRHGSWTRTRQLKPGHADLLLLVALFLLNPIIHGFRYPSNLTPDVVSYLTLAQDILSTGKLFIASSGHVDTGLIIPPLYPFLIGAANFISDHAIRNAEWISTACMLLVTIPMFLLVRQGANRYVAAATVLLFQLNAYNVYFASSILTEALFLLILISAIYLATRLMEADAPKGKSLLVLGILAGLLFLARQIGVTLLIFLLLWFAAGALLGQRARHRSVPRMMALILAGWASVVGGYAVALHVQTGMSPFRQTFRMQQYVVHSADSSVIEEIHRIGTMEESNYVDVYAKRRLTWKLLPDGSDMLANVVIPDGAQTANAGNIDDRLAQTALSRLGSPGEWLSDFFKNAWHLRLPLGIPIFILMAVSFITPFLLPDAGRRQTTRLAIPAFICIYTFIVSVFSAIVSRYLIVLFPLALIQVALELAVVHRWWSQRLSTVKLPDAVVPLILAALLILVPKKFYEAPRRPPDNINLGSWAALSTRVNAGAPIFALLPVYPYLAGGRYRILPNDSLEKTVRYARLTGVRWILVPKHPDRVPEIRFYTNAGWLLQPEHLHARTDLLKFCCAQDDEHLLFEVVR